MTTTSYSAEEMNAALAIAKIGQHTTPDACLKRAGELYKEGNWKEALAVLHVGLQNRKTKTNMQILEKLMVLMIDICADKLTLLYLKEDIGYFRNLC
jgi:predicted glycosyltransferase